MRHLFSLLASIAILAAASPARAGVIAGDNLAGPTTVSSHPGDRVNGFTIIENVTYDSAAGSWHKELSNVGSGPGMMLPSGQEVAVDETFVNGGLQTWTDWHEQILSTTDIGGGANYPGFLFTAGSLSVFRNGGLLSAGTDYTLMTDLFPDQVSPGGDWSAIWIVFSPGSSIQAGDTLRITKQLFEVFGDGNTWITDEIALVGQYPTVPEPSSLMLAALGIFGLMASARRRRLCLRS